MADKSMSKEDIKILVKIGVIIFMVMLAIVGIAYVVSSNVGDKKTQGRSQTQTQQSRSSQSPLGATGESTVESDGVITTSTSQAPANPFDDPMRESLPGENRAQLVNPDGETVYQRYKGNYSPEAGITLWGDAFKKPVERDSYVGAPPQVNESTMSDGVTDEKLSRKAMDMVTNMYSFRVQDYPHMTCALAGYQSEWIDKNLSRRLKDICAADPNPTAGWENLMQRDAFSRVVSLRENIQGVATGWDDTRNRTERVYVMEIGFYDAAGNVLAEPTTMMVYTTWKNVYGNWTLADITADTLEGQS